MYSAGFFYGTVDFDPGPGVLNRTSAGLNDMFVMKLDPNGNLLWVKTGGSGGTDVVNSLVVSPNGNIYMTGFFYGLVDFDFGAGIDTIRNADHPCNTEIFILKMDTAGNHIWAKSVEGVVTICTDATDVGYSVQLDQNENVYLTGYFRGSADFNPGHSVGDTFRLSVNGPIYTEDVYILKLTTSGDFVYAYNVGCVLSDIGYGIHVSQSGEVYVAGLYGCPVDFDPTAGFDTINSIGNWDGFLMKLDTAGNYSWAVGIGGSGDDRFMGVTTDAAGYVYATGHYTGVVDFDPSVAVHNLVAPSGQRGSFILKLDNQGNYIWAKGMTGIGGGERAGAYLATDNQMNVYLTGYFTETVDFNPSLLAADTFNLTAPGPWNNTNSYFMKVDSSGQFQWAYTTGTTGVDRGKCIQVDGAYNIYFCGYYTGTIDADPGAGADTLFGHGIDDIIVMKLSQPVSGTDEFSISEDQIQIIPNPADEMITVTSAHFVHYGNVRIFDLQGRMVQSENWTQSNRMEMNVSQLAPGIYTMKIETDAGSVSKKIIVH
ncbi:MAG: hypothetical protein Fur0041_22860 [Bacteroidia bacterium]